LQVSPGYYPTIGGVERHVQDVSEGLARLGNEVVVVTTTRERALAPVAVINGVVVHRLPAVGPQAYQFPIGLYGYLRRHAAGYQVVHAHSYHALPMLEALLVCGRRTVITPHYHGHGHTRLANILHRPYNLAAIPAMRRAGRIVCVSQAEADTVAERLRVPRRAILVVPNVVALAGLADARIERTQGGSEVVLLSVGRLEPYKRVDRLIQALPYLPDAYGLVVIGTGRDQRRLQDLAGALSLKPGRLRFLSRVSDEELQSWYARAQVLVSLSEAEAFGRTVLEALAAGCRVVCSDIPAYRELAAEFGADWVRSISPDIGPIQLADAVRAAGVAAPSRRPDLQPFAWQSVVGRLVDIYTDVAFGRPAEATPTGVENVAS
jgi:glycosyltransferase involved in cell wall biosynthesis